MATWLPAPPPRSGLSIVTSVGAAYVGLLGGAAATVARLGSHAQWVVVLDGIDMVRSRATSGEVTAAATVAIGPVGDAVRRATAADVEVVVLTTARAMGTFTARTHGLAVATRRWVFNLDADDEVLPGVLRLAATLEARGLLWGAGRVVHEDGTAQPCELPAGMVEMGLVHDRWLSGGGRVPPVHPGGLVMDTDLAMAVGGWPALAFAADTGLLLSVSEAAPGWLVDEPVALYRRWPGQLSLAVERSATFDERAGFMMRRVAASRRLLPGPVGHFASPRRKRNDS